MLEPGLLPLTLRSRAGREAGVRTDLAYTAAVRFDTVHDLADSECASLLIGDVPRFELRSDEVHCPAALLKSTLASAQERWHAPDEEDCRLQSVSIREHLQQRERTALDRLPRGDDASALLAHGLGVAGMLMAAASAQADTVPWTFASYAPGFALLRAARPDAVRSALAFE